MRTDFTLGTVAKRLPIGLMALLVVSSAGLVMFDWFTNAPSQRVDPSASLGLMSVEDAAPVTPRLATFASPMPSERIQITPDLTLPAISEPAPTHVAEQAPEPTTAPAPPQEPQISDTSANDSGRTFNGRPIRPARTIEMTVTAYSPDHLSCGEFADGYTASGYSVWTNGMKLVAADTSLLPFGSIVQVPGYNDDQPVPVLDRGGAIKGNRLDLLYPTHDVALQWGRQKLEVTVWEYADE